MVKVIDENELQQERSVDFPRVIIRHDRYEDIAVDSYEVQSMFSGCLDTATFDTEREALDYIEEELDFE